MIRKKKTEKGGKERKGRRVWRNLGSQVRSVACTPNLLLSDFNHFIMQESSKPKSSNRNFNHPNFVKVTMTSEKENSTSDLPTYVTIETDTQLNNK